MNEENKINAVQSADDGDIVIAVRDTDEVNHIRVIPHDAFRINEGKRKLIIFPGGKTTTPEKGNGMCKLVEKEFFPQLFASNEKQSLSPKEKLQYEKEYYQTQKIRQQYEICVVIYKKMNKALQTQYFFDNYIVPLVAKKNALGVLQRLDASEAVENMGYFTAVTHCYGAYIIKGIDDELKKLLPELGYTPEECEKIGRQSMVFNYNNIDESIGVEKPAMMHIHRIPLPDDVLKYEECRPGTYQRFIRGNKYGFQEPCIDVLSPHEIVLLTPQLSISGKDDHEGYWLPCEKKSKTGLQEQELFQAVSTAILSSEEKFQNTQEIVKQTAKYCRKNASLLKKTQENGVEHMDNFKKYCDSVELVARMTANQRRFR